MNKIFKINGLHIPYAVSNVGDYYRMIEHYTPEMVDHMVDFEGERTSLINQIIGLKISCYLLRHTTHICESVPDDLAALKIELIKQLKEKFDYDFKEEDMEKILPLSKPERSNV